MSKDQVLALLPNLSKEELTELIQLATHLLERHKDKKDEHSKLWFAAFTRILGRKGGQSAVLKESTAAEAEAFLTMLLGSRTANRVERAALRTYLVALLVSDLSRLKLTPTPKMLANNLPRLSEVVDNAFPGFRVSGLTPLIITRILAGVK